MKKLLVIPVIVFGATSLVYMSQVQARNSEHYSLTNNFLTFSGQEAREFFQWLPISNKTPGELPRGANSIAEGLIASLKSYGSVAWELTVQS